MARKDHKRPEGKLSSHGHRQRMRHRIIEHGADNFADYELLEMLLFYVIPRRDTKPLAKDLLRRFGSLTSLCQASHDALKEAGLTDRVASILKVPYLAARALATDQSDYATIHIKDITMLKTYLGNRIKAPMEESTSFLYLDGRNNLLKEEKLPKHQKISEYHRHIATQMLEHHATALIVIHIAPLHSAAVLAQEARGLALALKPLSILMHDTILFGSGWDSSLKREGLL